MGIRAGVVKETLGQYRIENIIVPYDRILQKTSLSFLLQNMHDNVYLKIVKKNA